MVIALKPALKRFVDEQIKSGKYSSANDVVEEALARLMVQPPDDFEPAELDALIAESEASLARHGGRSLEQVFGKLEQRSAAYRKQSKSAPKKAQ